MPNFSFLDHTGFIAIAHGGGAAKANESTMDTFRRTVALGYEYLELDVRATASGEVYVWHGRGRERLALKTPLNFAKIAHKRKDFPLLADVLREFPDIKFQIDPKHWPAVEPLAKVIADADAVDRICVSSFTSQRAQQVAQLLFTLTGKRVCTTMGPRAISGILLRSRTMPLHSWQSSFPCVQPPFRIVTKRFVQTAHAANLKVIPWTVNSRRDILRLLNMGVDGLFTDNPLRLKTILHERGQWN